MRIYNTKTGIRQLYNTPKGIEHLGYLQKDLPIEYLVSIHDKRPKLYCDHTPGAKRDILIKAPLQEQITTRTEATWAPLSAASLAKGFSELTQLLTGRTLVSRYANRQYWSGTSPLDFTLNLKFQAIDNVKDEVLRPIIELQRMSLPFSGTGAELYEEGEGSSWSDIAGNTFLAPPGPDPFTIGGRSIKEYIPGFKNLKNTTEDITVRIGTLLEIKQVIVKSIKIQQQPKMDPNGIPIEAIATVHFQTFEIITKETLDDIYRGGTFETIKTTAKSWLERPI